MDLGAAWQAQGGTRLLRAGAGPAARSGDHHSEAPAWDTLGYVHRGLGHHTEAAECYRRAVDLFDRLGHRYHKAETLTYAGDAYQTAGDQDAARDAWQQALAILDDLRHPDAAQVRASLDRLGAAGSS
ncbi:MAG: tetratricopeptide repeat protein [Micromonosporaceae bacterium]